MTTRSPTFTDEISSILRFSASFLWADNHVAEAERSFLRELARELGVDDPAFVEALLEHPPEPEHVDPKCVPPALAGAIRTASLRAIASDGTATPDEMDMFFVLDELLAPELPGGAILEGR